MSRWGMVIDLDRCIGCNTCAIACKVENNVPLGLSWNRIMTVGGDLADLPSGEYPNLSLEYLPLNCQHCDNAPCVQVCPTGATHYRPEGDGIVTLDYDRCIGCRYCVVACPYGVRQYNYREPLHEPDLKVGGENVRDRYIGVGEKCLFCEHRIDQGLKPFCIDVCPARARFFGDLDDPESEVSQLITKKESFRLLEELGTEPKVYFVRREVE